MNTIKQYLTEVLAEMSKVSWPTREELKESTVIVLVFSLVFGIAVYSMDTVFSYLLTLIL
ncbi:MAG: preprotein translocase subunit SecE [Bacteroidetes bacterium]|nr:preprotein translocase subunit SecE [Bacteroidota bacterium]